MTQFTQKTQFIDEREDMNDENVYRSNNKNKGDRK